MLEYFTLFIFCASTPKGNDEFVKFYLDIVHHRQDHCKIVAQN